MAKCPRCGKDIDYLQYEEIRTYAGTMTEGVMGSRAQYEIDHDDVEAHYNCPHCDEELATEESVALSILKGEEESEDSNGPSETPHPD